MYPTVLHVHHSPSPLFLSVFPVLLLSQALSWARTLDLPSLSLDSPYFSLSVMCAGVLPDMLDVKELQLALRYMGILFTIPDTQNLVSALGAHINVTAERASQVRQ